MSAEEATALAALKQLATRGDEATRIALTRAPLPESLVTWMAGFYAGDALACLVSGQRLTHAQQRLVMDRMEADPLHAGAVSGSALAEVADLAPDVAVRLWAAVERGEVAPLDVHAVRRTLAANPTTPMSLLAAMAVSPHQGRAGVVGLAERLAERPESDWVSLSAAELAALLDALDPRVREVALTHGARNRPAPRRTR